MAKKKQYHTDGSGEDAHIIHLKHQVDVKFDKDYDYCLKNPVKKFLSKIFVTFAVAVMSVINFFWFDLKVKNKKTLRALRKQKKAFITIANHCLIFDSVFSIVTTYPKTTYLPTVEPTMKMPFVRHILRALNIVPIPFDLKGMLKFRKDCMQVLSEGKVLHYFPEGALWPYYGKLREFKPGAFRFAVEADVPILPYCIYFRKRKGLWRLLGKKPLVTLEILQPIYPNKELAKKQAIEDLQQRSHAAMKVVIDAHSFDNPRYQDIEKALDEQAEQNTQTEHNAQAEQNTQTERNTQAEQNAQSEHNVLSEHTAQTEQSEQVENNLPLEQAEQIAQKNKQSAQSEQTEQNVKSDQN